MDFRYKLSVIVPCYNVELYLDLALDCLEKQWDNDKDIQFILVNDGSTDGTLQRLYLFEKKHKTNTIIVNKQNGGISSARNEGLRIVDGKYVTFFDPDDALIYGGYQYLYENYLSGNDVDTLAFKTNQMPAGDFDISYINDEAKSNKENDLEFEGSGKDFFLKFNTLVTWLFFYRTDVIRNNNLCFDEDLTYTEDTLFNLQYFLVEGLSVRRVDYKPHFWLNRMGSLSSVQDKRSKVTKMLKCNMTCLQRMEDVQIRNLNNEDLAKRIEELQVDKSRIGAMVLRSNLDSKQIVDLKQKLKKLGLYPIKWKGFKSFIYNTMFRFPFLFFLFRPLASCI